jgi:hypothetical protein
VKAARPVLNGGCEETCSNATRLAPTQPGSWRRLKPGVRLQNAAKRSTMERAGALRIRTYGTSGLMVVVLHGGPADIGGADAVVCEDVVPYAFVVGVPAHWKAWMCRCATCLPGGSNPGAPPTASCTRRRQREPCQLSGVFVARGLSIRTILSRLLLPSRREKEVS